MVQPVVPEGHRIDVSVAHPVPGVTERPGGLIAELGTASDAIESELAAVIHVIEEVLAKPRPRVVMTQGGGDIEALFAPNNPIVMPLDGLLLWVIDANALGSSPALVGRFVDQLRKHQIAQTVFVRDAGTPRAKAVIAAIQSLDIGVRELVPPDGVVLVEVTRSDGIILSVLQGKPLPRMPLAGLPDGILASVARAPQLRALLLASTDANRNALYAELRTREIPLVMLAHPDGLRRMTWDNGFHALPVFADRGSLLASARDAGLQPGSYSIGEMVPRVLFALAHDRGWAIAINVIDDAGATRYIAIDRADVQMLAGA